MADAASIARRVYVQRHVFLRLCGSSAEDIAKLLIWNIILSLPTIESLRGDCGRVCPKLRLDTERAPAALFKA